MCGIVAAVSRRPIGNILIESLKKLEYRGYDSAGMAALNTQGRLQRWRVVGKVRELMLLWEQEPTEAYIGIAHTRWATHGAPSEHNAHPFVSHDRIALVHNGIIENHSVLREKLLQAGYEFVSETDSETAVHLIHFYWQRTQNLLEAVRQAVAELEGAYALAVFALDEPEHLIGVRQGAPLVVGKGVQENFIASDPLALLSVTQQFIYLEDKDLVEISADEYRIYDAQHHLVSPEIHTLNLIQDVWERGEHRHYMKKEIMEQPAALLSCLEGRVIQHQLAGDLFPEQALAIFKQVKHIHLIACGTSYHAALVARYWIEAMLGIPVMVEVASEYRYRAIALPAHTLFIALSQSGETADTLAALRLAKKLPYLATIAIGNVSSSSMIREADFHLLTRAGVEIGVASTKTFVTKLAGLFLLVLQLSQAQSQAQTQQTELLKELERLPIIIEEVLRQDAAISSLAHSFTDQSHALFLGRGVLYPIALEGALKMKEISYIHAEAYPCGELKHGPLALVDNNMPVIASVPYDSLFEKTLSNLQEVRARGAKLYLFTDRVDILQQQEAFADAKMISMPAIHPLLSPILYTLPLQLLAYHVAVLKGTDVDQPRNLAKSVTVE